MSAPHHAEFKQVTVLFADVVRSMDLAASLGTERLREVMSELFKRSRTVVGQYGGSVDFTGDGVMAVFGAPVALEDHALRACLAALDLQQQVRQFDAEVHRRDGVGLQLRVGLNSGQVITGEIGSLPGSYTAIGSHVGMAQRMEAVAPPGGVMLSGSTARLVDGVVELGATQMVRIKNADAPVPARLLMSAAMSAGRGRRESSLVGRDTELRSLATHLDNALSGAGGIVGVIGPPGIGKSRLVTEVLRVGQGKGIGVVSTFCEAHARQVPFHAAARLFRNLTGVGSLHGQAARECVRNHLPGTDPAELLLLDDLLGIRESGSDIAAIDPDARRRRLSALLAAASAARPDPSVYVVEDAHWIDEASESTIADFLSLLRGSRSMALVTYRPEYRGRLAVHDAISLVPLDDSQSIVLIGELLGTHPSVASVADEIAEHAAGNPFFAEEIVRDLAERGVLRGRAGCYVAADGATVTGVPATLHSTIAARIDRLGDAAKNALNAAAVIGARFTESRLHHLVEQACIDELIAAEMIETMAAGTEYGFRHPLIRTVAYESQLRSERARLHRRLASIIEEHGPGTPEANAALIAGHLEAAGDLRAAFDWHMRAGAWLTGRNVAAACASWRCAAEVAQRLPAGDPDRLRLHIAASATLCGMAWRASLADAEAEFDKLRRLCAEQNDQRSLATGMSGYVMALTFHNRPRAASAHASVLVRLLERIGDDSLTVALSFGALAANWETAEVAEMDRMAQRVIDLAAGDPHEGGAIFGSPLALAIAIRGIAGMCFGRPGWKDDLDCAIGMSRTLEPLILVVTTLHKYAQIGLGALRPGPDALRDTAEALAAALRDGDDFTVVHAHLARGIVLLAGDGIDVDAGYEHLGLARCSALRGCGNASIVHIADIQFARRQSALGDLDGAISLAGGVVDALFSTGAVVWRAPAVIVLVEALLARGAYGDVSAARAAVERLATMPTDPGFVLHEIPLLRLRALLARADGDVLAERDFAARYLALARTCGFDGHAALAAVMVSESTHPQGRV
ncbi:ATP-binding protein [Mycolicibacterium sp. GCM10028919]|uniref:ATP-binding protein n=1 Tax=Mycolicibacterium sp. GCM10028919 TaxID=3273401 RepID=UPI0036079FAC